MPIESILGLFLAAGLLGAFLWLSVTMIVSRNARRQTFSELLHGLRTAPISTLLGIVLTFGAIGWLGLLVAGAIGLAPDRGAIYLWVPASLLVLVVLLMIFFNR